LPSTGAGAIAEGLARALDGSMKLPDADACRAYAAANFDSPVIADRVASIYHEALVDA
ncbi:glycosyltransferase family 1 protein, partial [Paraburkholderia bengalensis]